MWAGFYERIFNFRQIRYFDIEGKHTGLFSKALTSPDGKIRIPINESADEKSQIEEYLKDYNGEGIQHIAVGTEDIYAATDRLADNGLKFMPGPPDTYYERSFDRVTGHEEPVERMKAHGITNAELQRGKVNTMRSMERYYEERETTSSVTHAEELIRHVMQGETVPGIEAEWEMAQQYIPSVTREEVNSWVATLFEDAP